jgi:hypothetical protein
MRNSRRRAALALALMMADARGVAACPACLGTGAPKLTLVQQLVDSNESVVAAPGRDALHFIVRAPIRGARKPGEEIALSVAQAPWNGVGANGEVILGRHLFTRQWVALGAIAPGHEDWLRRLAVMKRTKALDEKDWAERASYFLDFLADPDPLVRATAYGELARAPYAAMRTLQPKLDHAALLRVYAQATDGEARALLILLLGLEGGATSRRWIGDALARASRESDATNLAALVTADLEGAGVDGLKQIEATYLGASPRGADEIHNVVVGLGVQGGRGGAIPQSDIVPLFRKTVATHPESAGAVAQIMDGWARFDLAPQMAALKDDARLDEGSQLLVANYLLSSSKAAKN